MAGMKFFVTESQVKEMKEWTKKHNQTCPRKTNMDVTIPESKYRITFRQSSVIAWVELLCDCGAHFSPNHDHI